jgi:hypothetical protein
MSTKEYISLYIFAFETIWSIAEITFHRISMFKGLFFLLIVTHFICDEYHAWLLMNLSNMTDFRQSNIIYKTNNNHFCFHFSLHFRFCVFVFMKTGSLFECRICWECRGAAQTRSGRPLFIVRPVPTPHEFITSPSACLKHHISRSILSGTLTHLPLSWLILVLPKFSKILINLLKGHHHEVFFLSAFHPIMKEDVGSKILLVLIKNCSRQISFFMSFAVFSLFA